MASDKMLGSFDQKSAPEDNDLLVEYDASASKVKNVKFGGVWNWIVKKLTSAVINELQTSSKNVVGAINELNSNTLKHSTYALIDPKNGKDIELENGRTYIVCYGTIGNDNVYNIGTSLILSRVHNNVKGCVLSISSIDKVKISLDGNVLKVNTAIWLRLTINML